MSKSYLFYSEFGQFLASLDISTNVEKSGNDKLNACGIGFTDDTDLAMRMTLLQAHELDLNLDNYVLMLPPECQHIGFKNTSVAA